MNIGDFVNFTTHSPQPQEPARDRMMAEMYGEPSIARSSSTTLNSDASEYSTLDLEPLNSEDMRLPNLPNDFGDGIAGAMQEREVEIIEERFRREMLLSEALRFGNLELAQKIVREFALLSDEKLAIDQKSIMNRNNQLVKQTSAHKNSANKKSGSSGLQQTTSASTRSKDELESAKHFQEVVNKVRKELGLDKTITPQDLVVYGTSALGINYSDSELTIRQRLNRLNKELTISRLGAKETTANTTRYVEVCNIIKESLEMESNLKPVEVETKAKIMLSLSFNSTLNARERMEEIVKQLA
jgi:ribosomal protein S25